VITHSIIPFLIAQTWFLKISSRFCNLVSLLHPKVHSLQSYILAPKEDHGTAVTGVKTLS